MRAGAAIDKFSGWFVDKALPVWANTGVDTCGGFYENLDFDGAPMPGRRRVRVQCRQVHTFTEAGLRGWHPNVEKIAARGFDRLLATAVPKDGVRGCVHTLHDGGAVDQHLRDLYDQAFLLLACATRVKAVGDPRAAKVAANTLAFLDREFSSPHGGYRENDRGGHPRRQNPHMHLFEALMALFSATGSALYLDRARAIEALFQDKFFESKASVLREYFNDDWSLIEKVSDRIEPGHMAEWVALLTRFEQLTGDSRAELKAALYKGAMSRRVPGTPFLPNTTMLGSRPDRADRRLWPQTEFLRAAFALGDHQHAEALIAALFQSYFDQSVEGVWCDEYDASGDPIATSVPASILYHLMEAVCLASDARKDISQ